MQQKLCAISVDLDPLTAYYQIHGLGDAPKQVRATIMQKVLPRFGELFADAGVPATMFVVGRELERSAEAREALGAMVRDGHELANHTYSHPYDLCRLPETVIEQEIRKAHDAIVQVTGEERGPVGFRSPGYFINGRVLQVLTGAGYRYDSSMFPSPPYWLAKVAVMGGMALRGRRSASVLTDPRGLSAPRDPYRPHYQKPWTRGDAPLIELPVTVLPTTRVPVIGTLFAAGPSWLRGYALEAVKKLHFFNFELHGIDLADAVDDSIPTELAGRQPDLRIPFAEKRRIFLDTIRTLKQQFRFVTLADAARELEAEV